MCLKSDLLPFNFTICQRRNKLAPDTKHYMAFTVLGIEDASIQNTQTPYHYTKSLMKKREFFSLKFIQIYLLFYMYCLFLFPWFLIEKKKPFKILNGWINKMMWEQTESHKQESVTAIPLDIPTSSVQGSLFFTSLPMLLSLVLFCFIFFF